MRNLIPGERIIEKLDVDVVERLKELSPYVRQSGNDWRAPWLMRERRLLDYLAVYIGGGEGEFSVDGDLFPVKSNDLIWIPPDTPHEMRGTSSLMNCVYIHFDLKYDPKRSHWDACIPGGTLDLAEFAELVHPPIADPIIASWKGKITLSDHLTVMRLMKEICLTRRRSSPAFRQLTSRGLMLELIEELVSQSIPAMDGAHPYWEKMQVTAVQIIDAAGSDVSVSELAKRQGLSVSHFRRVFQEVHGVSPMKMLMREKLSLAAERLVYTNSTLAEIADELGYGNVHNFSRAFKTAMAISPGAYRKNHN
jgi:AraC-like DNA-binding protein